MTAIFSAVNAGVVFQVSDRLISLVDRRGKVVGDHDAASNKTVVVVGPDAMVSISYSGLAYLEGVPTDAWLARWASGNPELSPRGGMSLARRVPMQAQAILDRLLAGLEAQTARDRKSGLEIVVAGRQARRNNEAVPVLWRISARPDEPPELVRRDTGHRRMTALSFESIGSADKGIVDDLATIVDGRTVRTGEDADAVEGTLVRAMREAARAGPGIGPSSMSVRLWTDDLPHVSARYWPVEPEDTTLSDGTAVPAAYSPWLVTPKAIIGPALYFGGRGGASPEGVSFEVYVPPGPVWDGDTLLAGFDTPDRAPPPAGRE